MTFTIVEGQVCPFLIRLMVEVTDAVGGDGSRHMRLLRSGCVTIIRVRVASAVGAKKNTERWLDDVGL